ncbi:MULTISPECIES: 3'-5' exonuclease [unclassified Halomonas]|uniref:3'-5' exonuclease n=1 Tax=unclassified Halomonas TaxID=2609666 RepID=UPI00054E7099|nr:MULTISPECIES: 3'-5' exonuclease [unclassified Halomonas]CEP36300.1 DNA polymerase III subunit epsilon-like protein [Halomonas sp. R57-5]
MTRGGLPKRQRLMGLWLLLSGISLLGGAIFAAWLDAQLAPTGVTRIALWLGSFSGGATIFLVGLLLERMLFTPLRHLQVQLARLVANPDARDEHPPEGWLKGLGPDLRRVRESWRSDRSRLATAHADGARSAARIRQELETLLQVLETPLLLCDHHRRLMLFNQAAEDFFEGNTGLGLGKRLEALLPVASLQQVLSQLPNDGSPRELLAPCDDRWLKVILRRVPGSDGETLLTFSDATASWSNEMGVRAELADMLTPLRQHTASLTSAADALIQLRNQNDASTSALRQRFERVIQEEGATLGDNVAKIGQLLDDMQHQGERLTPMWSNDFWQALDERLDPEHRLITPVGMPAWFKGDAPALIALFDSLVKHLNTHLPDSGFEGEICLGNKRVYLDLIWRGKAIPEHELGEWRQQPLNSLPLTPSVADVLRQHASDIWSLADDNGVYSRLRLPLPAMERVGAPRETAPPRPEFHDFGIADLPPPDEALASRTLRSLEIVAFDTETTGLELRRGDTVISLGACRVVNARLLASEVFDQKVDPQRPIPPASTAIHGLTDADVAGAPPLDIVLTRFRDYVGEAVLLAHNAAFDLLAISHKGVAFDIPIIDTLLISRALDEALDGHDLDSLAQRYDLAFPPGTRHTALGDARVTAELWLALLPRLEARGVDTLEQLLALQANAFDRQDASAL